MKYGKSMDLYDPKVDLKGQGHRSKVTITRSKNIISGLLWVYSPNPQGNMVFIYCFPKASGSIGRTSDLFFLYFFTFRDTVEPRLMNTLVRRTPPLNE